MSQQPPSFWFSSKGLAALGLIAAVSYFLFVEHREHVFQALPYLIILLCPLMHIFMHSGHGGHGGHGGHHHSQDRDQSEEEAYRRGLEQGRREQRHDHHH